MSALRALPESTSLNTAMYDSCFNIGKLHRPAPCQLRDHGIRVPPKESHNASAPAFTRPAARLPYRPAVRRPCTRAPLPRIGASTVSAR
jgi:hypothetical protein